MRTAIALACLLSLVAGSTATAQQKELKVGDPAPGLDLETWLNGDEASIEEGKVYVIDFWATWCEPCRRVMPHLIELQERYAPDGLVVIGVTDEEEDVVERFLSRRGASINYRIATDRRGATKRSWMDAADLKGIPHAFIVDRRGVIQWMGNPLAESRQFDKVLELVLHGRYDARLFEASKPLLRDIERLRKQRNWRMYHQQIDTLMEADRYIMAPYALDKFEAMLLDQDDPEAAYEYAEGLINSYGDDPELLGMMARKIASDPGIPNEKRNFEVALKLAETAHERFSGSDKSQALSIRALVHYQKGDYDEAVQLQKKAYFQVDPRTKQEYRRILLKYQRAREGGTATFVR